mgnify:CR=1 FL=1
MTLSEFFKTTLMGMAGWALFSVMVSIITSLVKDYKIELLNHSITESKKMFQHLLDQSEDIKKAENKILDELEKRKIVK